jgi:hypothetical protein
MHRLREPEIEDLHLPLGREHEVVRLEVPVEDPLAVGFDERIGHLDGDVQRLAQGELAAGHELGEIRALDGLHGDVGAPLPLPHVEDLQMFGWSSRATAWASRRRRARLSGSSAG